ncbi:MAG: hypothetical protein ACOH2F_09870 [Cellulomonas sp.]
MARKWTGAPPTSSQESALWDIIRDTRSRPVTYALLNLEARSTDIYQQVAAATALASITRGTSEFAASILGENRNFPDSEISEISRVALSRSSEFFPLTINAVDSIPLPKKISRFAIKKDTGTSPDTGPIADAEISTCIHGTWARHAHNRWYVPKSSLFQHIKEFATPGLFDKRDYFRWTSGYTEDARSAGADDLINWRKKNGSEFDTVYAHSHGGNVALEAAERGEQIRLLVLLHAPITRRSAEQWALIKANVGRIASFRTRADLVMLADGLHTGSSLDLPADVLRGGSVMPHVTNPGGYFSHRYYLREEVWEEYDIASDIALERKLARW